MVSSLLEFNSIQQLKSQENIFNHGIIKPTMKTRQRMKRDTLLQATSREAFDFYMLDNVLFISATSWSTTRPLKHPYDSDEELVMIIDNKRNSFTSHSERRTSIQSDAYSTELIRRFSSGSTTSSLSSISSSYFSSQGDAQTHSKEHQPNEQIPLEKQRQPEERTQHNDSGHKDCDTSLPVWADPIRVAENPTRFQYLIAYMRQQKCPPSLPLQTPCLFYFSQNTQDYVNAIQLILQVDTVWRFSSCWRTLKEYRKPSEFGINQNLYCFVQGVQPMWEDPVNAKGGRFVISSNMLDNLFEWLLCAFVGGQLLDDGCVGVVVSKKSRGDRVELWFDQLMTMDRIPLLKEKLCGLLSSTCHHEISASRFKKHFHS